MRYGLLAAAGRNIARPAAFNRRRGGLCTCRHQEAGMVDRHALGMIGLMLCTATALVMMVGAVVVNDHLTGRLHIDDSSPVTMLAVPPAR
jgi:hypothetical protein